MRIAEVDLIRVNNAYGGTERIFITLANAFVKRGHEVSCLYYDPVQGAPVVTPDPRIRLRNGCVGAVSHLIRAFCMLRALLIRNRIERHIMRSRAKEKVLLHELRKFKPDVILFFWPDPALKAVMSLGVPVIQMAHNASPYLARLPAVMATKKELTACAAVQVLTSWQADDIKKTIPNPNIAVIPNIVPSYKKASPLTGKTIIYAGRLCWEKRPDILVAAFGLLKDRFPDWKVEIWGEGFAEPAVTAKIKKMREDLGLNGRVLLCGTTKNIEDRLERASIIAMPSVMEGFCLALTEGMAKGLPAVVCSDCETFKEIVKDKVTGFSCAPEAASYAEGLAALMADEGLRRKMGQAARKDMERFSEEKVCEKWEALFGEVLKKAGKAPAGSL